MEKRLGKIENVYFGNCGYQEACIGINFTFSGGSWCVGWEKSFWNDQIIEVSKNTEWTELDRDKNYAEIMRYITKLLEEAKVDRIDKLKGIPIEVTFDENMIKDFRILTEVI